MALQLPQPVIVEKPLINALIYGTPGSGKTVLSASGADHPDMGPVLIASIEGGLLSLGNKKNVHQVRISSVDELEELFWAIAHKKDGFNKFKTVVIDSGSEVQTMHLEQLALTAFDKETQALKDGKKKEAKRESRDQIFQDDYGKDTARLKRVFRWFRDAPVHTIITALAKKEYSKPPSRDIEPTLTAVLPSFTDKLGQCVMGYVDYVWYTFQDENGKFKILTSEKGVYRAKTRGMKFAPALGQVVESPNLGEIYDLLLKSEQ